ncbi:MAG TPA: hypothetical protein VGK67_35500 [Myxococcales bacterium]
MNVVASSRRSARWLCQTLFSRWRQENGLKHAVERWGLNQLDGRRVEQVPEGTLVTNPARANLDRLLRDDKQRGAPTPPPTPIRCTPAIPSEGS